MPVWLIILFAVISALSTIGSVIVALITRLSRGNFAEFKLEIIKIIDDKLTEFIKKHDFQIYSESHSREHKVLDEEIVKLRAFKHDIGAEIRKTGSQIEDIKDDLKDIKKATEE